MVMPMFFGVDRTGPLDFVGIKGAQLRLIRLQEQTNEDSNNEDNESDKGFLHACQSPFLFTQGHIMPDNSLPSHKTAAKWTSRGEDRR